MIAKYLNHYRGFNQAIWLNIFAAFVNTLGFIPGTFMALYLVHVKHFSVHETAILLSLCSAASMIGAAWGGMLGDRYSPVKLCGWSLLLLGIATALFPFSNGTVLVLIAAALLYFIYSVFRPLNNIILMAHSTVTDRPRVMGFYRMAFNLGLSVSMVVGGFLADHDFAWYFYFSGLMSLLAAGCFSRFQGMMAIPASWHRAKEGDIKLAKLHIFKNKPFMWLSLIYLGYCLIYYQVRMTFGFYMTGHYHLRFSTFGMLYVINMLMIVVLEVPLMSRLKHQNQIKVCMVGMVFIAIGLGMLPLYSSLIFAIFSVMLWSLGEILTSSPFYALVMDYANPRAKGAYLGFFQSLMSAGGILAQALGGFLYTIADGKLLWFSCFFGSLILMIAFMHLLKMDANRLK